MEIIKLADYSIRKLGNVVMKNLPYNPHIGCKQKCSFYLGHIFPDSEARGCGNVNTTCLQQKNKAKAISAKLLELNWNVQLYNALFLWLRDALKNKIHRNLRIFNKGGRGVWANPKVLRHFLCTNIKKNFVEKGGWTKSKLLGTFYTGFWWNITQKEPQN